MAAAGLQAGWLAGWRASGRRVAPRCLPAERALPLASCGAASWPASGGRLISAPNRLLAGWPETTLPLAPLMTPMKRTTTRGGGGRHFTLCTLHFALYNLHFTCDTRDGCLSASDNNKRGPVKRQHKSKLATLASRAGQSSCRNCFRESRLVRAFRAHLAGESTARLSARARAPL